MKRDLYFSKPLMNAAGSLGFVPDQRAGIPFETFGAFVTNPLSLRPRQPTSKPAVIEYPGGFLLHTGLPNPGLSKAISMYKGRWDRADLPILLHLMADRPEETLHMVKMLEGMDNLLGIELGFAPLLANDIILMTLEMCLGEMPLIFSLPPDQVLSLGPRLVEKGAAAISLAAPRGTMMNAHGHWIGGRMYGPSMLPRSLEIVHSAAQIGLPVIGAGGIWNDRDVESMLSAGAMAVQMDACLWLPRESYTAPEPD
jgi:dihydroorotate dehydrogenase